MEFVFDREFRFRSTTSNRLDEKFRKMNEAFELSSEFERSNVPVEIPVESNLERFPMLFRFQKIRSEKNIRLEF